MSGYRLTDAQIASALRAHLPAHARSDVRARISDEVRTARQQRPMPWVLGRLSDADPDARRRATLLAAAALVSLGLLLGAAAGAVLRRDQPIDRLTIDPAADPAGFVEQAYAAHRGLPAMEVIARMWDDEGSPVDVQRFVLDGAGSIRHECCGGAIEIQTPDGTLTAQDPGTGELEWVAGTLPDRVAEHQLITYTQFLGPACELGWRYVGPEVVASRAAHHVRCPHEQEGDVEVPDTELWIDAELGIVVRTRTWGIQMDENNEPVATVGSNMELVSIELGQPDPAEFKAPVGVTVLTVQEVLCRDDPASCETGPPETPLPVTTPEPGPFVLFPPDPAQLVTDTLANYAGLPAMRIEIEGRGGALSWHRYTDGERSSRDELHFSAVEPPTVYLGNDEGWFESWPTDEEPNAWVRHGTAPGPSIASFTLGLPETCPDGWRYLGLDVLLGSAAWHIDCGGEQYWIDRDRLLVVRQVAKPDPLAFDVPTQTVHLVEIGPQPPELFELPADAVVEER